MKTRSTQWLIIAGFVASGLILMWLVSSLIKQLGQKPDLPLTKQQAQKQNQAIEEIEHRMNDSEVYSSGDQSFYNLSTITKTCAWSIHQENNLKQIIKTHLPEINSFNFQTKSIKKHSDVKYGITVTNCYFDFIAKQKTYNVNTVHQDEYALFIIIKQDDKIIFKTATHDHADSHDHNH